MGRYKDEHGKTRVGNFLQEVAPEILGTVSSLTGIPALEKIGDEIDKHRTLSYEQKKLAQELLLLDKQEITKRWESDNQSDSFLARNVRPMTLIYLLTVFSLLAILDTVSSYQVKEIWVKALIFMLECAMIAYFGERTIRKFVGK